MDKILRTLICDGQISLAILETTDLVNEAIKIHCTSWHTSRLFGELLTGVAYMASCLKEDSGCISLIIKAKDGDGAVSVSADKQLHVRGYVDGSCTESLDGGTLTVVREDGYSKPFVGTCEMFSSIISNELAKYFQQSEQIPTAVFVDAQFGKGDKCTWAGGVVMQLLPNCEEEKQWEASDVFDKVFNRSLHVWEGVSMAPEDVFNDLFAPMASGEAVTSYPVYKCNCSEQKIRGVLSTLSKQELLDICKEQGEIKVHCHYCNKDYVYDRAFVEENFK